MSNIQEIITKVLEDADKNHEANKKAMRERMEEKGKIMQALHAIRLPGVKVPEIAGHELRWTTHIKVDGVKMFPVLQKILGCTFEHYGKEPIGDGRKKMVRVSMIIKGNDKLRHDLMFQYDRKLTDNDKCKVVTETQRVTRVVCTRK